MTNSVKQQKYPIISLDIKVIKLPIKNRFTKNEVAHNHQSLVCKLTDNQGHIGYGESVIHDNTAGKINQIKENVTRFVKQISPISTETLLQSYEDLPKGCEITMASWLIFETAILDLLARQYRQTLYSFITASSASIAPRTETIGIYESMTLKKVLSRYQGQKRQGLVVDVGSGNDFYRLQLIRNTFGTSLGITIQPTQQWSLKKFKETNLDQYKLLGVWGVVNPVEIKTKKDLKEYQWIKNNTYLGTIAHFSKELVAIDVSEMQLAIDIIEFDLQSFWSILATIKKLNQFISLGISCSLKVPLSASPILEQATLCCSNCIPKLSYVLSYNAEYDRSHEKYQVTNDTDSNEFINVSKIFGLGIHLKEISTLFV
ncbi:hypothetical protein DID75_02615 [Candidatus Marinamargulisbacteria bacterium SCGC AG-410-N11]|nr:hypothetical protein DID75_02615 [Candidatus Marinamargulisbacteria bacterium SCGC AG-410-N11]